MPVEGGPRLHLASNNSHSGPPPAHAFNDASTNSSGSSATGPANNVSSLVINAANTTMTAQPSTGEDGGSAVPGGVIALMVCLLVVGVAVFCIILYLKKTGKLYKMIPFKRLASSPRRSSFSSSERALHMKDAAQDDVDYNDDEENEVPMSPSSAVASGRRHNNNNSSSGEGGGREGEREAATMFTIEDHDLDSVDIGEGTSEYFYDEVFGKPVFEDEATNASMRQLYLASDNAEEEDIVDVDAIVDSIVGKKPKTATT